MADGSSPEDEVALERAHAFPEPHFPSLNTTMKKSQSMNFVNVEDKPQEDDVQLISKDDDKEASGAEDLKPDDDHRSNSEGETSDSSIIDRGISPAYNMHDQDMAIPEDTAAPEIREEIKEQSPDKVPDIHASPSGPRNLTRIQSEAALRLKMLFPDQEDDQDSPST
eukprot:jgi/Picre1/28287/NNA_003693.t1